jgi:glucose-6-phosphate 1-dehydrogenase
MDAFMQDVTYFQGLYDEDSSFEELSSFLKEQVRNDWHFCIRHVSSVVVYFDNCVVYKELG